LCKTQDLTPQVVVTPCVVVTTDTIVFTHSDS
jgi:hypothetical protein